jgi:predicted outer membrane protein
MRFQQRRFWIGGVTAVLASLSVVALVAQERPRLRDRTNTGNSASATAKGADHTIADCLGVGNQEEIALATLAASKTQNPQVKEFAEALVRDHGQFLSQLEPFGARKIDLARRNHGQLDGQQPRTPERPARPEVATREAPADRDAGGTQRTAARESGLNFMDVKRQMAQKCLESAQKNWTEHKGAQADLCFVGQQTVVHQQMIDAQEVLKQYASPELQKVIDEGIAATQAHLDHAKKLMDQLLASYEPGNRDAPREGTRENARD